MEPGTRFIPRTPYPTGAATDGISWGAFSFGDTRLQFSFFTWVLQSLYVTV